MSGLNQISEMKIPSGKITEKQLNRLLQTLVAKHGLTDAEIASCFYRKNCNGRSLLLEIRYDKRNHTRECGHDPYYSASFVNESGEVLLCPTLE